VRLEAGCWAKRNGYAQQGGRPYNTDIFHTPPKVQKGDAAYDPGVSRAYECEGFGAYYDQSGDIISVTKGYPASRATPRPFQPGMRITQVKIGDPQNPLVELKQEAEWIKVDEFDMGSNGPDLGPNGGPNRPMETGASWGVREVEVGVMKDDQGSIGATFHEFGASGAHGMGSGVKIDWVDPKQVNGIYQAMQSGYPWGWPGFTGGSGSGDSTVAISGKVPKGKSSVGAGAIWNCDTSKGGKWCFPCIRRGARPGFIIKEIGGQPVETLWDLQRVMSQMPMVQKDANGDLPAFGPLKKDMYACGGQRQQCEINGAKVQCPESPKECIMLKVQITTQAVLDMYLSAVSPDKTISMRMSLDQQAKPMDNAGVEFRVKDGNLVLPNPGTGGLQPVTTDVSDTGVIMDKVWDIGADMKHPAGMKVTTQHLTDGVGVPCEACIRQMPSVDAIVGCLQGMCDWTPKLQGNSTRWCSRRSRTSTPGTSASTSAARRRCARRSSGGPSRWTASCWQSRTSRWWALGCTSRRGTTSCARTGA
jgi:hypothetical protein